MWAGWVAMCSDPPVSKAKSSARRCSAATRSSPGVPSGPIVTRWIVSRSVTEIHASPSRILIPLAPGTLGERGRRRSSVSQSVQRGSWVSTARTRPLRLSQTSSVRPSGANVQPLRKAASGTVTQSVTVALRSTRQIRPGGVPTSPPLAHRSPSAARASPVTAVGRVTKVSTAPERGS